jgi:hypothetical protein
MNLIQSKKLPKVLFIVIALFVFLTAIATPTYAAADVSSAIKSTWDAAAEQIKSVTNDVIFPAVDLVLAILFFVKLATSYFDYKKHGQFEFTGAAILFFGLIFSLTAPLYIWQILGI